MCLQSFFAPAFEADQSRTGLAHVLLRLLNLCNRSEWSGQEHSQRLGVLMGIHNLRVGLVDHRSHLAPYHQF